MQATPIMWRDSRPYYISMSSAGRRTVYTSDVIVCVCVLSNVYLNLRKETWVKSDNEHGLGKHQHQQKQIKYVTIL